MNKEIKREAKEICARKRSTFMKYIFMYFVGIIGFVLIKYILSYIYLAVLFGEPITIDEFLFIGLLPPHLEPLFSFLSAVVSSCFICKFILVANGEPEHFTKSITFKVLILSVIQFVFTKLPVAILNEVWRLNDIPEARLILFWVNIITLFISVALYYSYTLLILYPNKNVLLIVKLSFQLVVKNFTKMIRFNVSFFFWFLLQYLAAILGEIISSWEGWGNLFIFGDIIGTLLAVSIFGVGIVFYPYYYSAKLIFTKRQKEENGLLAE